MQWIDRLGLVLHFLAFSLAAPALLGAGRLKDWRRQLERLLMSVIIVMWFLLLSFLWIMFSDLIPAEMVEMMPTIWLTSTTAVLCIVCALPFIIPGGVQKRVVQPIMQQLADDPRSRHRFLAVGAILFILGFLMQLAGTFFG
jgi:hypothetical protein